jgi:hypothetical protein
MCSGATKPQCFSYRVLGLPRGRLGDVSRIRRGAALFLYDFDSKYLYGPYRADSDGGLALEPAAFEGRYPAQVPPLPRPLKKWQEQRLELGDLPFDASLRCGFWRWHISVAR